ncbi:MAG: prolyl oligopeptidase family serine peptidase [Verrucomicrobiales bacterium]|nr:prolyl oligopeptidase family serine peptidase [Verrucomicrobiales bacterium]
MSRLLKCLSALVLGGVSVGFALEPIPPIERILPRGGGIELSPDETVALEYRLEALESAIWEVDFKEHAGDVGVLVKAVRFALDHREFYAEKDVEVAREMLALAEARLVDLKQSDSPAWLQERGLLVRGYESSIDESYQPYGLEVPEALDLSQPVPMLVWLHGRGEQVSDLHFLKRCLTKSQALGGFIGDQEEVIVLHPFGRQCVGWKHAGEVDVFEAIVAVMEDYPVDPDRVALAGFSMGGAGAWHIGAHYRDRFCAVHAGAGFAETREYNQLTPELYPPDYVQTLWQLYDVPSYVGNLTRGPLLAYSGEEDKQKQAADLMARELRSLGIELNHIIGAGMGHKYNQESVDEIWKWLRGAWKEGRPGAPEERRWQTPTLRYPGDHWLQLTGLGKHWVSASARANWSREEKVISIESENVTALKLLAGPDTDLSGVSISIDDETIKGADPGFKVEGISLVKEAGGWRVGEAGEPRKKPGLQGPIDDAFMSRFIVVPPDTVPASPIFARWLDFELGHFRSRWKALMRGVLMEKSSDKLTPEDISEANLILWGDPASNKMLAKMAEQLPVKWEGESFFFRGRDYHLNEAVPVFIFPNPLNPDRYVVLNSGLTFRENHDRTNSQQNPKLPDWSVIGLNQFPDAEAPGRIIEAGFFDERWR